MQINLLTFNQSELCVELSPRPSSGLSSTDLVPLRLSISWRHNESFNLQVTDLYRCSGVSWWMELQGPCLCYRWRKGWRDWWGASCRAGEQSSVPPCWRSCRIMWVRQSYCLRSRHWGPGEFHTWDLGESHTWDPGVPENIDGLLLLLRLCCSFAIDWRPSQRLLIYLKSASLVFHLQVEEGYPRGGRARLVSVRKDGHPVDASGLKVLGLLVPHFLKSDVEGGG